MKTVTSADGTSIAYEVTGTGPALILVGGAFCDRATSSSGTPLAELLAHRFTVFSYDRRGRGDSGEARPHAIAREVEDLATLVTAAGGSAALFGNSSGGLLALDAIVSGLAIPKLVVYEPPVILDPDRAAEFARLATELDECAASNRRSEAVELFMTKVLQMPAPAIAHMRGAPVWAGLERLAHTLSYDLLLTAHARLAEMANVRAATLVMDGSASPPWMRAAVQTLAEAIPGAQHRTLEGQTHAVDPAALARAIEGFLEKK